MVLGPHSSSQTVSTSYATCKIHHETCRNEGIRKSRMQITKIRKIKAVTCSHYNRGTRRKIEQIPRSLVAPLRGAGGSKIQAVKCFQYNRGSRIQDRGDAAQPGGPSTEGQAEIVCIYIYIYIRIYLYVYIYIYNYMYI